MILLSLSASALLAAAALVACSEAASDGTGTPAETGNDASATGSDAPATQSEPDAATTVTPDATAPSDDGGELSPDGGLVLNELCGKGTDYVELYNAGAAPVDLTGWGVTDEDHDAGTPKASDTITFTSGTTLAPGTYALVYGAPKDDAAAPTCAASVCLIATWNVSSSKGETIYVVNSSGSIVESAALPANGTSSGQSWGRLPNGTGSFALNRQTPGAADQGP